MTKRKQIFNSYWITSNGDVYNSKNELLKIQTYQNGYKYVHIEGHNRLIHRLVAMAFLPDYSEDKQVHHINENKADNRLENLKVMTIIEHQILHKQIYSVTKVCEVCGKVYIPNKTKRKRSHVCSNECKIKLDKINAEKRQVAIKQYSKNGDFIKTWKSARACQNETGYFESNINKCCNGKIKSLKGISGNMLKYRRTYNPLDIKKDAQELTWAITILLTPEAPINLYHTALILTTIKK